MTVIMGIRISALTPIHNAQKATFATVVRMASFVPQDRHSNSWGVEFRCIHASGHPITNKHPTGYKAWRFP